MGFINVIIDKKEYKVDDDTDFIYLNDKKIGMYDWDEGDIILDDTTSEEDTDSTESDSSDTDSVPSDYDSDDYQFIKGSIGWKEEKEAKKKEKEGKETKEKEETGDPQISKVKFSDMTLAEKSKASGIEEDFLKTFLEEDPDFDPLLYDTDAKDIIPSDVGSAEWLKKHPVDEDDFAYDSDGEAHYIIPKDSSEEEQEKEEELKEMTSEERIEYFIKNIPFGEHTDEHLYGDPKRTEKLVMRQVKYWSGKGKNYDAMKDYEIMKDIIRDRYEKPPNKAKFARIYNLGASDWQPIKFLMNLRKWNFMDDMPEWMVKRDWLQGKYDEMINGEYVIPFINTDDPMAKYEDEDTDDDTTTSEEEEEEDSEEDDPATKYKKEHPDEDTDDDTTTSEEEEEEEEIVQKDKGKSKKAHSDAIKKLIEGEGELTFEVVGDPGYSPGFKYKV